MLILAIWAVSVFGPELIVVMAVRKGHGRLGCHTRCSHALRPPLTCLASIDQRSALRPFNTPQAYGWGVLFFMVTNHNV